MVSQGREYLRRRWSIVERRVRSDRVVVFMSLFDDDLGFLQAVEDFTVQRLVAKFSVEGLAVAIPPGAAWFDEQDFGSNLRQPVAQDLCRHLSAIVGSDVLGHAPITSARVGSSLRSSPPGLLSSASRFTIQASVARLRSNVSASRWTMAPPFLITTWAVKALEPSLRVRPIIVPTARHGS
jgi:hypothetical protein